MKITVEHFPGTHPQFNVSLASAEGKEPFLTVKGCRIVDGTKGEFVSWPATKNEKTGKYWNHVWASDAFNAAVLQAAKDAAPKPANRKPAPVEDDDIPF